MANKSKASGPLWATVDSDDDLVGSCSEMEGAGGRNVPCRLLPGHGKWVPVELVEAIEAQWNSSLNISDEWVERVRAAIRAAREGAI